MDLKQRNVREEDRQPNGGDSSDRRVKPVRDQKAEDSGLGVTDVLRILGGLLLLNCLLSYFITNNSVMWGWRPWYSRPGAVMRYIVSRHCYPITYAFTR